MSQAPCSLTLFRKVLVPSLPQGAGDLGLWEQLLRRVYLKVPPPSAAAVSVGEAVSPLCFSEGG